MAYIKMLWRKLTNMKTFQKGVYVEGAQRASQSETGVDIDNKLNELTTNSFDGVLSVTLESDTYKVKLPAAGTYRVGGAIRGIAFVRKVASIYQITISTADKYYTGSGALDATVNLTVHEYADKEYVDVFKYTTIEPSYLQASNACPAGCELQSTFFKAFYNKNQIIFRYQYKLTNTTASTITTSNKGTLAHSLFDLPGEVAKKIVDLAGVTADKTTSSALISSYNNASTLLSGNNITSYPQSLFLNSRMVLNNTTTANRVSLDTIVDFVTNKPFTAGSSVLIDGTIILVL